MFRTTLRAINSPRFYRTANAKMTKFQAGQTVEYKPIGGPNSNTSVSSGVIERVLTETAPAGDTGISAKASPDSPRYEIRNSNTGKTSALKEENIIRSLD